MTIKEAITRFSNKYGPYERCYRKDHGIGETIAYGGKVGPCCFVICPTISFYPKPSYRFFSWRDFVKMVEEEQL